MPWNLSAEERLAGFLNRILPSAGGSSPVDEMSVCRSLQGGRCAHKNQFILVLKITYPCLCQVAFPPSSSSLPLQSGLHFLGLLLEVTHPHDRFRCRHPVWASPGADKGT